MTNSNLSTPSRPTAITTCDGPCLKRLIAAGLAWFERHYEEVNRLNVFPVPDGDTGTNMLLTLRSAYARLNADNSSSVSDLLNSLTAGARHGSLGNSGTLLSEMFRGFAESLSKQQDFEASQLATGFRAAVKLAYQAIQNPVEGTMLTVAREITDEVETQVSQTADLRLILQRAVERGAQSLARTPDLLPILKKAGVVDSGGRGLLLFLEGMLRHANGENLEPTGAPLTATSSISSDLKTTLTSPDARGYGYDVQYILRGHNLDVEAIRNAIGQMGDSMIVVGDQTEVKVHIHVHDPGIPISYGVKLGVIEEVVIENMQGQADQYIARRDSEMAISTHITVNKGDIAVVAVALGEGLRHVFYQLGVAGVVSGGQTMNPSADDILQAIRAIPTDKIIVLPNNKNIVLTAEQAARLSHEESAKTVSVLSTHSVPQGIAAMLSFAATGELDRVVETMQDAYRSVVTGEITTATRSVDFDGLTIESGKLIGLVDGKLVVTGDDLPKLVHELLEQMRAREREIITLYYGEPTRDSEADALLKTLQDDYTHQEFDLVWGGQPFYHYIISVE